MLRRDGLLPRAPHRGPRRGLAGGAARAVRSGPRASSCHRPRPASTEEQLTEVLLDSLRFVPYPDAAPALGASARRSASAPRWSRTGTARCAAVLAELGLGGLVDAVVMSAEVGAAQAGPAHLRGGARGGSMPSRARTLRGRLARRGRRGRTRGGHPLRAVGSQRLGAGRRGRRAHRHPGQSPGFAERLPYRLTALMDARPPDAQLGLPGTGRGTGRRRRPLPGRRGARADRPGRGRDDARCSRRS